MKVLLLSAPYKTDYMRNARCDFISQSHTQWYPVLLGAAGALLEKHGHTTQFIDAPAAGLKFEQTTSLARDFDPDVLVVYGGRLSAQTDQHYTEQLCELLNCKSIFVGPYVSMDPAKWMRATKRVAAAVDGEFEFPVLEFVEGKPLNQIRNLVYRGDDTILRNELRPYLGTEELDEVPFVSQYLKKQVNIKQYRTISEPFPYMDILTGHGCAWGRCSYCLWVHTYVKGSVYNQRSIENVLGEITYICTWMPEVKSIMFQDDTLIAERASAISEGMLARGLNIKWSCYARADLDLSTMKLMKRAGCLNLHVGFESTNEKVLKLSKKGILRERMEQFVRDARRAGLHIHGDFLMGLEGETRESLHETIRWASKLRVDTAQFQVIIPFEGTPLYQSLKEKGCLREGESPDYPGLSTTDMHKIAQKGYRAFYLQPRQILLMLRHPRSRLFHYLKAAHRIIPAVFGPVGNK